MRELNRSIIRRQRDPLLMCTKVL